MSYVTKWMVLKKTLTVIMWLHRMCVGDFIDFFYPKGRKYAQHKMEFCDYLDTSFSINEIWDTTCNSPTPLNYNYNNYLLCNLQLVQ